MRFRVISIISKNNGIKGAIMNKNVVIAGLSTIVLALVLVILFHNPSIEPTEQNEADVEESASLYLEKSSLREGMRAGKFTIASVEISDGYVSDVTFSGEIELTGEYFYSEYTGDGDGYIFNAGTSGAARLPVVQGVNEGEGAFLLLSNYETAFKAFGYSAGEATIIIDNFSVGERQMGSMARLVRVVSKNIKEADVREGTDY